MTRHSLDTPQFYLTAPSTCPYLPGRQERKVFTHLVGERAADLNDLLTQGGFRRSQSIAYRPACENCRACISVRVLVDEFRPTRSLRRVRQRNADVSGEMRVATPTSEQYGVFRAYLDARHPDGDMADMTLLDYAMMIEDSHVNTCLVEYRRRAKSIDRLLTAYQEGLLSLDELRERMPDLRRREQTANTELQALLDQSVDRATFAKEVLVGDDKIIIRHSIPLPTGGDSPSPQRSNAIVPGTGSYLLRSGSPEPNACQRVHEPVPQTLAAHGTS